ncbi:hypothetical protein IAQ67_15235 [Paenibacillus peoriae]|uniref:Uncharacterized protein n=1 Tax=Paenibacillus peoriae TaxID=59893 RepID=A0A7H0Y2F7_9BACL|nr:hypothetical protein [Paenibacillus peoriae]QNR65265.1 hypothetical protein IAQ67_15235 [Paenibacillus peoriae]
MNIPLQIYDFIAVLFPGIVLISFIQSQHPEVAVWQDAGQVGTIAVIVVVAYIGGQLLTTLSGMLERVKWIKWFFIGEKQVGGDQIAFQSRTTTVIMSQKKAEAVKEAFKNVYGYDMDITSSENFGMIYSIVHDRMAKRDMFLAIANMMRTTLMLAFAFLFYYLAKMLILQSVFITPHVAFIVFDFCLIFLFRQSYSKFKSFSDSIPFDSFLAWYKQQTLKKESTS